MQNCELGNVEQEAADAVHHQQAIETQRLSRYRPALQRENRRQNLEGKKDLLPSSRNRVCLQKQK